ncbi:ComEC/Rec2 family competence protein [Croceibacterium ferulae]|uniref:ComEC/Rec2 family competence protein n=1 Tax=Croceibacterium ferulae TaxID=1854641 RepID=UPI000EB411B9|nr:ComEC/Rec2 family competence protein [Croceibacterium ferulae]
MATEQWPAIPLTDEDAIAALQHPHWRKRLRLSSMAEDAGDRVDRFLAAAGFDRAPWLAVALVAGIAAWFAGPGPGWWVAAIAGGLLLATAAAALWRGRDERYHLLAACVALGLVFAGGVALIWLRSEAVGTPALQRPVAGPLTGRIVDRIEQPAEGRVRLVLATREGETGRAVKVRVNLPLEDEDARLVEGALIRLEARLMPPASPMVPGGYDFARIAWFQGLAATGAASGPVEVLQGAPEGGALGPLQRSLADHVRARLSGSSGAIAAALASGDRGAIAPADEEAMRDAGLTHLLSISGLHVSALIGAAYLLALRLLALSPWLALRLRLPLIAAATAALAGIGYTLLTGAEVPTVRSCLGALLVLCALALGREPLSLRMLAVAAMLVLLIWPESLIGPSFQLSFAAVIAIVALHDSAPVRAFLAPREEPGWRRSVRRLAMLLASGLVIEWALMPIVLFHFHRAGIYGAFANVIAIPLVTFVCMPLIALALLLDLVGLGAPAWWLAGHSLDLMLGLAHLTASQPNAVHLLPQMGGGTFALFVAGGLWLALWHGRVRLLGLVPVATATILLLTTPVPDLLVTGDGRHVAISGEGERLLVLRPLREGFAREVLGELAANGGEPLPLAEWPDARCSRDFCSIELLREGRRWRVLMSRSRRLVDAAQLSRACSAADIVVADRRLPRTCVPREIRADRWSLARTGGLAIDLGRTAEVTSVSDSQGEHGWWRGWRD